MKLHIGGREAKEGWKILDVDRRPEVDFVGSCVDLGQFPDNSIAELYASHVIEHLSFKGELQAALKEFHRVLEPGGKCRLAVPDFETLCQMFIRPDLKLQQRFEIMQVVFGGQNTPHDFHRVGLSFALLGVFLHDAGFVEIRRVSGFGLFHDSSEMAFLHPALSSTPISLNVEAAKSR